MIIRIMKMMNGTTTPSTDISLRRVRWLLSYRVHGDVSGTKAQPPAKSSHATSATSCRPPPSADVARDLHDLLSNRPTSRVHCYSTRKTPRQPFVSDRSRVPKALLPTPHVLRRVARTSKIIFGETATEKASLTPTRRPGPLRRSRYSPPQLHTSLDTRRKQSGFSPVTLASSAPPLYTLLSYTMNT